MSLNEKEFGCGCDLVGTDKKCGDHVMKEYCISQCLCSSCYKERREYEALKPKSKPRTEIIGKGEGNLELDGVAAFILLVLFLIFVGGVLI